MKTDQRVIDQIIERSKARKDRMRQIKIEIDRLTSEYEFCRDKDRTRDLAKEFGIGKSTIDRIVSKL